MKIYAATPITGLTAEERSEMSLRAWAFIDATYADKDPDVYMAIDHFDVEESSHETAVRNYQHLLMADAVVAFNPSTSRGAHLELGYALGKGLEAHIINFKRFPIDDDALMLHAFEHFNGDKGPERYDHFDECVLRGTPARPTERCGCVDAEIV